MRAQEESSDHFFTSFTDLLVGVIFLFILLLMVFALNLKKKEDEPAPKITTESIRTGLIEEISLRMQAQGAHVVLDPANGIIRLPESLLFASGEWKLSPEGEALVAQLAGVFEQVLPCMARANAPCQWQKQPLELNAVLIEGHTDKRPFADARGNTNWELSAFRAITVYKAMVAAQPGLEAGLRNPGGQPLLGVSAYAERRPVDTENLDPNRRIDIRFTMHAVDVLPEGAHAAP